MNCYRIYKVGVTKKDVEEGQKDRRTRKTLWQPIKEAVQRGRTQVEVKKTIGDARGDKFFKHED